MQAIKRIFHIDRAAFYGVIAKAASGLTWLAVAMAVSLHLSPAMQGYFFTFLSLVTVQMLFDLGLGTAIIQFTAHEWSALSNAGAVDNGSVAASRLRSILCFSVFWYFIGAVILLTVLLLLGFYYFRGAPPGVWPGAWTLLCTTVSCDFALLAFWNVLEGCNQIQRVYGYRALKAIVLGGSIYLALGAGFGLSSLGLGYLLTLPLSLGMLAGKNAKLLAWIYRCPRYPRVDWREEIMPLQWRLAVSFGSGYFAQWGITPITFKLFGPVAAGQFGMVWSIVNAITAAASVLVYIRAPQYGILIAARRFRELDRLAFRISVLSIGAAALGCTAIGLAIYLLNAMHSPHAARVLPLGLSLVMLAATVLWQVANPLAVYLRSHKREPYLWLSAGFAGGMIVLTLLGGWLFGEWGVVLAYFLLIACFFLPGAILIFLRCRRAWHAPLPGEGWDPGGPTGSVDTLAGHL